MGQSGSIQERRQFRSHDEGRHINNRLNYTPNQMQAMYLSGSRPDAGFMTNDLQTMRTAQSVPELQQTYTVKNYVNLKKKSILLQAVSTSTFNLSFEIDAMKACQVCVYIVAKENMNELKESTYSLLYETKIPVYKELIQEGLGQKIILKDANALDLSQYTASELSYNGITNIHQYPLIIEIIVNGDLQEPQSQTTYLTFMRAKDDTNWESVKIILQKIVVGGATYELQEIYGMDGSIVATSNSEEKRNTNVGDEAGSYDTVDIPDGAECIICLSEPRNTTVLPCRHMCLCSECAEALRKNASLCPICRTPVESLLQLKRGEA